MRFMLTDDTTIGRSAEASGIKGAESYELHQAYSKYRGRVSKDVVELAESFRVPRTIEAAKELLVTRGYTFGTIAQRKLENTIKFLVQVGVLVVLMDDTQAEFSPIILSDEESVRSINLGDTDIDALAASVASLRDNHPVPENALDTKSGYGRPRSKP